MKLETTERQASFLGGALVPVLWLLLFVTRAFHIDDPRYIWTVRHIQTNPLDFYGFDVNWDGFAKTTVLKKEPAEWHVVVVLNGAGAPFQEVRYHD